MMKFPIHSQYMEKKMFQITNQILSISGDSVSFSWYTVVQNPASSTNGAIALNGKCPTAYQSMLIGLRETREAVSQE